MTSRVADPSSRKRSGTESSSAGADLTSLRPGMAGPHDQHELVQQTRRQTFLARRKAVTAHDSQVELVRPDAVLGRLRRRAGTASSTRRRSSAPPGRSPAGRGLPRTAPRRAGTSRSPPRRRCPRRGPCPPRRSGVACGASPALRRAPRTGVTRPRTRNPRCSGPESAYTRPPPCGNPPMGATASTIAQDPAASALTAVLVLITLSSRRSTAERTGVDATRVPHRNAGNPVSWRKLPVV